MFRFLLTRIETLISNSCLPKHKRNLRLTLAQIEGGEAEKQYLKRGKWARESQFAAYACVLVTSING